MPSLNTVAVVSCHERTPHVGSGAEPWREGLGGGTRVLQQEIQIDGKSLGVGNETGSETTGRGRKGSLGGWAWSSLVGPG